MTGFTEQTFTILSELAENNTKDWYHANKARLQQQARAPFEAMLGTVSMLLEGSRCPLIGGASTMFRQNRDVRFSNDKAPYKTTVSGMLTGTGAKFDSGGLVFAQIGPEGGMIAAGFYRLAPSDLGPIRDAIVADPARFAAIRAGLEAKGYPLRTEDTLKSMPRGYAEHADHPQADAIRLKSFVVRADQPKAVWLNGDIVERLVELAEATGPLLDFGRAALARRPG